MTISSVAWTPDGQYILSGDEDGLTIRWKVDLNDVLGIVCNKVNCNFTQIVCVNEKII